MDKSEELRMLVETITATESRRQLAATTHITATAVVAAFLSTMEYQSSLLPSCVMLLISVSWLSHTISYNRLLRAKWHVAEELQESIGIRTFIDEHEQLALSEGLFSTSISKSEYFLPALIATGSLAHILSLMVQSSQ